MTRLGILAAAATLATLPLATQAQPIDVSGPFFGFHVTGVLGETDWGPTYANLDNEPRGGFGGVFGGYNWQNGNLVYGLDLILSAGSADGSTPCPNPAFNCETDIRAFAALRARIGMAMQNGHVYAAVGGVGAEIQHRTPDAVTGIPFDDVTSTATGWTVALGYENPVGAGNWMFRSEIAYYEFGDITIANDPTTITTTGTTVSVGLFTRF